MSEFRRVTDAYSVSPQLRLQDLKTAASEGFRQVINNRPDGEEPGQPSSDEMRKAAEAAGLAYVHLPNRGMPPSIDQARAQVEAAADGPTLAFCRSGTRSISAWAIGQALAGAEGDEIVRLCRGAGYDVAPLIG